MLCRPRLYRPVQVGNREKLSRFALPFTLALWNRDDFALLSGTVLSLLWKRTKSVPSRFRFKRDSENGVLKSFYMLTNLPLIAFIFSSVKESSIHWPSTRKHLLCEFVSNDRLSTFNSRPYYYLIFSLFKKFVEEVKDKEKDLENVNKHGEAFLTEAKVNKQVVPCFICLLFYFCKSVRVDFISVWSWRI